MQRFMLREECLVRLRSHRLKATVTDGIKGPIPVLSMRKDRRRNGVCCCPSEAPFGLQE